MNEAFGDFLQTGIRHYGYDQTGGQSAFEREKERAALKIASLRDRASAICTHGCGRRIFFATTSNGKRIALDFEVVTEGERFLLKPMGHHLEASYRGASFRVRDKAPGHRRHVCEEGK